MERLGESIYYGTEPWVLAVGAITAVVLFIVSFAVAARPGRPLRAIAIAGFVASLSGLLAKEAYRIWVLKEPLDGPVGPVCEMALPPNFPTRPTRKQARSERLGKLLAEGALTAEAARRAGKLLRDEVSR